MFKLLMLLGAVAAGAWFYPPQAEGVAGHCAALESKVAGLMHAQARGGQPGAGQGGDPATAGLLAMLQGGLKFTGGTLGETYVRDRYPNLPPALGCVVGYWTLTFNPDLIGYATAPAAR